MLRSLGPIGVGLILDALDIATVGPIGIYLGFIIGFCFIYFLLKKKRVSKNLKIILSIISGLYLSIPGTSILPLATIAGIILKVFKNKD